MPALLLSNLGVVCGTCDSLSPPGTAKCIACGANVADAPAVRPKPVALSEAPTSPSGSQAVPPGLKRAQPLPVAPSVAPVVAPVAPSPLPPPIAAVPHLAAVPAIAPVLPVPHPAPLPAAPPAAAAKTQPNPVVSAPPDEQNLLDESPLLDAEVDAGPTAPVPPPPPPPRPTFSSSQPEAHAAGPRFGLAVLAGPSRGQRFKLASTGAQVGRNRGVILFPEDPFVSPQHATFLVRDGRLVVRDDNSTSGCYVSIAGQETVPPGAMFCTGIRLFRYLGAIAQPPPAVPGKVLVYGAPVPPTQEHYAVEEVLLGGRPGRTVITAGPILTIGQGKCDLSFPNDDAMAQRHCELSPMPSGAMIRDLSGGLGTFVRVQGERVLKAGDRVRIGQQTLQVEVLA